MSDNTEYDRTEYEKYVDNIVHPLPAASTPYESKIIRIANACLELIHDRDLAMMAFQTIVERLPVDKV